MAQTEHIVPNALLSVPDPNAALMQKCKVFPVEFVVRGFLTGKYPMQAFMIIFNLARSVCPSVL